MKKVFSKALTVSCLASALALASVGAQAAHEAGLTRVSADEIARVRGLTADYVRTPHGYFHASCVEHVDQSESLEADGTIRRADGKLRPVAACRFPHFLRSGMRVEATAGATHTPDTYNGYLQLVSAVIPSGATKLTGYMTVPTAPVTKSGQTLYFFPGLEDSHNVVTILQPVLGWDGYGQNNWTIASWNCCKDGTTFVGNNVVVKSGDLIYGTMVHGFAQTWTITATDQTQVSLPSATLATKGYGQVFDWVFGASLETYGVTSCSQFPRTGPAKFTETKAYISGVLVAKPTWVIEPGTDPMTSCTHSKILNFKDINIGY